MMTIKEFVALRKTQLIEEISNLEIKPSFAIVKVNKDEASNAYVKGKIKDANEVGIPVQLIELDEKISEEELLIEIDKLNKNPAIHGLIVQMPLPRHIDEEKIKLAVSPNKDIDGFHPLSHLAPCTPRGIMSYLKHEKIDLVGKNAVVIGRSNIVGKPMAKLLLEANANVTILHSKTKREDMERYIENADVIVIAIGRSGFLNESFKYKKTAVIVDVGINRVDGKLHGDAIPNLDVYLQTPVPGGVGLLTRLSLLENLLEVYKYEL